MIKPLFDRVVLEPEKTDKPAVSGIFLPDSSKEKSQVAKVVAVGVGGKVDGEQVEMQVKVGDRVLYSKYAGTEFKIDGRELLIIKQSDILAIIGEKD